MSVIFRNFYFNPTWIPDFDEKYDNGLPEGWPEQLRGRVKFNVPQTADPNPKYLNEREFVRIECAGLTVMTPFFHPIACITNVAYRILKLATLSHFWSEKDGETKYDFKARLADAGKDLLRIVATPISILGLELAAIYGTFRPYDGRKLYASIERATYGNLILVF